VAPTNQIKERRWRDMSGPSLNQRDAHHAIHQAAFREAEQLTLLLRQALRAGEQQQALQLAALLIEHWQTRTLRHADAEEAGWYRELLTARPELEADVTALTRDHEHLRILLAEIQGILSARGVASGVVERFEAMLLLNGIHSRTEEQRLLGDEHTDTQDDHPNEHQADGRMDDHTPDETIVASMPLAVARPALYERLVELLRQRGLNPADLLVELRDSAEEPVVLHVAYGQAYAQTMEWPLRDDAPDTVAEANATEAVETVLLQVVEACERATKADYHVRMRTPT
jgi:hypothetical protein